MEYNDNLISLPEEFAFLAKEYSNALKKAKNTLNENCLKILLELNYIYGYIKRNVRKQKIITLMNNLEKQTVLDLSDLKQFYQTNCENIKFYKARYNNLRICLKRSISLETKFISSLMLDSNNNYYEIILNHLSNLYIFNDLL